MLHSQMRRLHLTPSSTSNDSHLLGCSLFCPLQVTYEHLCETCDCFLDASSLFKSLQSRPVLSCRPDGSRKASAYLYPGNRRYRSNRTFRGPSRRVCSPLSRPANGSLQLRFASLLLWRRNLPVKGSTPSGCFHDQASPCYERTGRCYPTSRAGLADQVPASGSLRRIFA